MKKFFRTRYRVVEYTGSKFNPQLRYWWSPIWFTVGDSCDSAFLSTREDALERIEECKTGGIVKIEYIN